MIRRANPDDAAAIANVHIKSWRSTYCGLMPDAVLNDLSVERRTAFWRSVTERAKNQFVFVVEDESQIVGFVNGGPPQEADPHYTAELYALYLLEAYQGYGYGKALFKATVKTFVERGHTGMLLWVLSTNPARGFYERLGGLHLKTKPIDIGGVTLTEDAYGWDDLPSLLARYDSASA